MINILPREQKIILRNEYRLRRLTVWLALICSALFVSLVLLLPSYLMSRTRLSEVRSEFDLSKAALDESLDSPEVVAKIENGVRDAADLKPLVKGKSVYGLMRVFEAKPDAIKISSVSYKVKPPEQPSVVVTGLATNRESLTTFSRSLEGRPEFASVDLPVSNLAKERNIDFSLTILLK